MYVFPLIKQSYGDFDICIERTVAVFTTEASCDAQANLLNGRLTEEEKQAGVEFITGERIKFKDY